MPRKIAITDHDRQLVRSFIAAQRYIRQLDHQNPDPLPLAEVHTLIMLSQHKHPAPGQLAEFLHVNLSKISRLVQRLEKQQLITVSASLKDARQKELRLSKKGSMFLSELDRLIDQKTLGWLKKLPQSQQATLSSFLAALADILGAPPEAAERKEVSIRVYQRRIARAGGLIAGAPFESDLNLTEYQILNLLGTQEALITMDTLFSLPFDKAVISRASDFLHRTGHIIKERDSLDSRRVLVEITAKGRKTFLNAEEKAAQIMSSASNRLEKSQRLQLLKTLRAIAS